LGTNELFAKGPESQRHGTPHAKGFKPSKAKRLSKALGSAEGTKAEYLFPQITDQTREKLLQLVLERHQDLTVYPPGLKHPEQVVRHIMLTIGCMMAGIRIPFHGVPMVFSERDVTEEIPRIISAANLKETPEQCGKVFVGRIQAIILEEFRRKLFPQNAHLALHHPDRKEQFAEIKHLYRKGLWPLERFRALGKSLGLSKWWDNAWWGGMCDSTEG
jgi:hypothetical protein